MLIASPRSPSPNHVMTARPEAPLTLPPSAPTIAMQVASRATPAPSAGVTAAAITASRAPVEVSPVSRTRRSPNRSVSSPHPMSDAATPSARQASTSPSAPVDR
ncbi:hypothetical protein GCM10022224_076110 [Nonomuraea antimicrobica]|uniref:Uncharacterized protein n=1 Tax=Nonomuraea antimicrobica TaxID=561173 RepID=A0ABP7D489_9ACTN